MANEAWKVHQNFIWTIETITPTSTISTDYFRFYDPNKVSGDEASGMTRAFYVEWNGASEGLEIEDGYYREAVHDFSVEVIYSEKFGAEDLHKLMLSDRHDIIKALRDSSSWDGYDPSHTTDLIGLRDRKYLQSEKIETDGAVRLRMAFSTIISEQEQ